MQNLPMQSFIALHAACNAAGFPCGYWGERGNWLVVCGTNRDADFLSRSNFRSILRILGGEGESVAVEREGHWACGWVEYILVNPSSPLVGMAEKILADLSDYPVVDEDDWSSLESEEAWECAESELRKWEGWEDIWEEISREGNWSSSDDMAFWEDIEEAKSRLEELDEARENFAHSQIDPAQAKLFPGIPPIVFRYRFSWEGAD